MVHLPPKHLATRAYLLDRMWEAAATDHPSLESMWEAAGSSTVAISNHTSTRTLLSSMPDDSDEKWRAMKRRLPGPSSVEQIPAFSPTLLPQISIDEIEASSSAEDETDLRREWITYYWSAGEIERAYELGWSGEWERRNGGLMPVIGDPRDDAVHEAIRTADRKLLQVPKVAVSPDGATWAVEQQTASSPPHFVPGVSGAGVLREGRCSSGMLSWPPSAAAMNSMAIVDVGRPSSSAVTASRVEDDEYKMLQSQSERSDDGERGRCALGRHRIGCDLRRSILFDDAAGEAAIARDDGCGGRFR